MNTLRKVSRLLIGNFFLIYLIAQLFVLSRGWDPPFPQIIFVFNAVYGICLISQINRFVAMDYIVLLYISYIFFNGLFSDYPNKEYLFYKALVIQLSCVFFYFVGRCRSFDIKILDHNRWYLLTTSVLGIYFFFTMPGWYAQMKANMIVGDTTYMSMGETMRLSAFWAHPYYLVYGMMSVTPFILLDIFKWKKHSLIVYAEFAIVAITLVLAQLRVAIVCFILFILFNLYSNTKNKFKFLISTAIITMLTTTFLGFIIFHYMDADSILYIYEHSSGMDVESRFRATSGGYQLDTLFGGGFGRYSLKVGNRFAIVDNEYQKLLAESGIFGFSIVIVIFIFSLIKMKNIKNRDVEKMIVVFYMIACFGASCLSNIMQYPFVFWLALGSLWNGRLLNRYNLVSSKNRKI